MATKKGKEKSQSLKKTEPKKLFVFQNQEYDLQRLTSEQVAYLKQFPDEVPFLQ